jgi:ornithine cyclodeaminase
LTVVLELDEIQPLVDASQLISDIAEGFVLYSEGRVTVPPVGFLHFDDPPGDVHIKYGAVNCDDYYVLKIASAFHDNPQLGLPASNGSVLVFSQKTGALKLVLLDECWLTDMRTAAAGAVAAKYLAPKNVHCIGIVGTGVQARMQLELLRDVIDCRQCFVWGRDPKKARQMIDELATRPAIQDWGIEIDLAPALDELVSTCNLIVTTTPARSPLIRADLVRRGTHITAMGSDDHGKQELESALLAKADFVVADSISQCIDHGECCSAIRGEYIAVSDILELGNVIRNPGIGRTSDDQISIADLTGVAIQDIQIAKMIDLALDPGSKRGVVV